MFTEKVMREVEILNTDLLKVGTKVYVKRRGSYSIDGNGGIDDNWDDEGFGVIKESSESYITIIYDGYTIGTYMTLNVEDLNDHFYSIEIV